MKNFVKSFILLNIMFSSYLLANKVDVLAVNYDCDKSRICSFDVTLEHNDTGWKHYANKYDILANGKVIATRILWHPHIDEQPFTRSISNIKIPNGVTSVIIRGHDLVHGYGGTELQVYLKFN